MKEIQNAAIAFLALGLFVAVPAMADKPEHAGKPDKHAGMGNDGGAQGPDLSGLGARTAPADVLMSIVQPSAVLSDQYANSVIGRVDGGKTIGRILNEEGDKLELSVNPFDPSVTISVNRSDILSIDRSPDSPMPVGLINSLNAQEVADLLAYLVSGANPKDSLYSK